MMADARDRTSALRTRVAAYSSATEEIDTSTPAIPQGNSAAQRVNAAASAISSQLQRCALDLESLSGLARDRSLFQDHSTRVDDLTAVVKQQITGIAAELQALQDFVNASSTGAEQTDRHSAQVVKSLRGEVAKATETFAQVLRTRSRNLRQQTDRRKKLGDTTSVVPSRNRRAFVPDEQMSLMAQEEKDGSQEYYAQREASVKEIEQTVAELSQMYAQLATLMASQEEMVIYIDDNVDRANMAVTAGHGELLKYMENLAGNRWLILKIFATIILFAMFFIIFVA